jgi:EpsI family protein
MAIRALIAALLVALVGAYAHTLGARAASVQKVPDLGGLPATVDGWTSQDFALSANVARVLDADRVLQRLYRRRDGREVMVFVAYFAQQAVNSQIHSPRHCVPGGGWRVVRVDQEVLSLPSGPQTAARMLVSRNGQEQQLDYWFRTRSGSLTGEYALKWDLVRNALAGRPTDALFVRYSADVADLPAMHDIMMTLDGPLTTLQREVGLQ